MHIALLKNPASDRKRRNVMKRKMKLIAGSLFGLIVFGHVCFAADATNFPAPLDLKKAQAEVEQRYARAHPEIKEYVLYTAQTFGRSALWLNEDAFAAAPVDAREKRIEHLATLLKTANTGATCARD